jgi:hypothetical protein
MVALNNKSKLLIIVLIVVAFTTSVAWSDNGLSISPGSVNIQMQAPQTYQGQVSVTNIGNTPLNVTVNKKRILQDGKTTIYMDDGIATWITATPTNFTLAPGANQVVKYTINIPNNVNYYDAEGALQIVGIPSQKTSENNGFSAHITQATALVVPIRVGYPGPITESLSMVSHNASPFLLSLMPGNLVYQVNNNGTVQAKMTNEITVKGLFENQKLNSTNGTAYPGDQFTLKSQWTPGFFDMGFYTVESNINYGRDAQDQNLTSTNTVFVFPTWLIILILIIITVWVIRKKEIKSPIEIKRRK